MALPANQVERIQVAAALHDVGKLFIPRDILEQPGPLTAEQWVELRHHPRMGYEMIRDWVPAEVAQVVLTHHERFDGTGYPNAITGTAIPLEARILQVADAVDAITSVRPYKPALSFDYAVDEIDRCSGTQFDPAVAEAFMTLALRPEWRARLTSEAMELVDDLAG
jgi:HD-GYP domain-containing protein (c-di-GMP phosphodiesterase class II)